MDCFPSRELLSLWEAPATCGLDMDPELVTQIRTRFETYSVPLLYEEDFSANLAARMICTRKTARSPVLSCGR